MSESNLSQTAFSRIRAEFWRVLLAALLLASLLGTFNMLWGSLAPAPLLPVAAAVFGLVLSAASSDFRKPYLGTVVRLVPFLVMLLFWFGELWQGLLLWVNCGIAAWNQLHQDGVALFTATATAQSVQTLSTIFAYVSGVFCWHLVQKRRLLLCTAFGVLLTVGLLLIGGFSALICALYLSGLLGLWMSSAGQPPVRQAVHLWALCTVLLMVGVAFTPDGSDLNSVSQLRTLAKQQIHSMRYGDDILPQGNLRKAAMMNNNDTIPLLHVQTGQEKSLYLRGFVGMTYKDGVWTPPTNNLYGGDYSGMLDWLDAQNFDPLTQTAAYLSLCEGADVPETNRVIVHTVGASKYYLYTPAGLQQILALKTTRDHDTRLRSRNFFGADLYTLDEISSARPAELTVRADWVSHPRTTEQSQYAQAEAVYRDFVYHTYTTPDESLESMLNQIFWEDYAPSQDGIYSALGNVRNKLNTLTEFDRTPQSIPEDSDPIRSFLNGTTTGNATFYASAAVQALRAHGIPARYVEGYFLSSAAAAVSGDKGVTLYGQDAHAWVEIYFDGIGWLPVDVTPGYYYDTVTLQQMVSLPDTVHKTATLDNGTDGADSVSDLSGANSHPLPSPVIIARNIGLIVLGLIATLVILLTLVLLLLELMRLLDNTIWRRRYLRGPQETQVLMLQERIFFMLTVRGYDACLGWNDKDLDATLAARFPLLAPNDYHNAVRLMEKSIYGGETLEPFEMRALRSFLAKISQVEKPGCERIYWILHYGWLFRNVSAKQNSRK